MLDLSNSLNAAMHPISFSAGTFPTGSVHQGLAFLGDERLDIIMIDAGTENASETLKSLKREAPGYKRSKVSEAPKLLKKPEGIMASEPKHSTTSHAEKICASDILKIRQIHAFDYGSDQEISTA